MRVYYITYDGVWLGGKGIVLAKSKKTALRLLEEDGRTVEFNDVEVIEVIELDKPQVIYNDNGDY